MPATRTHVYLTEEQRRRIDRIARERGVTTAEVIRTALDEYLGDEDVASTALAATFGAVPDLAVPSRDEWDRVRKNPFRERRSR